MILKKIGMCDTIQKGRGDFMLRITDGTTINITRGDIATFNISAKDNDGSTHTFQIGDVVRMSVCEKKNVENVYIQKDVVVETERTTIPISLTSEDTKLDDYINKPVVYWYEICLNPESNPQTIIGYDDDGAKLFIIYPESDVI